MMGRQPLLKASAPVLWTLGNTATELWLRPSDPNTVSLSSGVSQIISANGNGRILVGAAGSRPGYVPNLLNNRAGLTLNGSQFLTFSGPASTFNFLHNTSGSIVVAVWKAGIVNDPNAVYTLLGTNAAASVNTGYYIIYDDRLTQSRNNRVFIQVSRGQSGTVASQQTANDAHLPNVPVIITHICDPGNPVPAQRSQLRINGTLVAQGNTDANAASSGVASFPLQVCAAGNGIAPMVGELNELAILSLSGGLAIAQRSEGYLAWEFNLQGNLAAGHPFRNSPPYL